jgi:large subunit ribosomal protein L6
VKRKILHLAARTAPLFTEEIMSRVGKKPITIPSGVTVSINDGEIEVKGPKGTLKSPIPQGITFKQEEDKLIAERANEDQSAFHGLGRALANNAIVGVTEGFKKEMDLVGVGYKAEVQGNKIVFALGYSHPVEYVLPQGIEAKTERVNTKTTINQYQLTLTLTGIDKQKLGQVAAELNRLRKPDAYKGKGVRYADKYYRLKPGKTGK